MSIWPLVFAAARQADRKWDRDPEGCASLLFGGLLFGFLVVVAWWILPDDLEEDWSVPVAIALLLSPWVALVVAAVVASLWGKMTGRAEKGGLVPSQKTTLAKLDATKGDGFRTRTGHAKAEPSGRLPSRPTNTQSGFRPAKSGNGFTRSLNIDGWWTNCWVGRTRGALRATVFAPRKNGVQVQKVPLLEHDCNSEEEAFAWLRDAEESGQIRREALSAIRRFENGDDDLDADELAVTAGSPSSSIGGTTSRRVALSPALKPTGRSPRIGSSAGGHRGNDDRP